MTDLILGSEVNEFVANRQYAKIQYLQQENIQLQEQVKDLDKALKLNKELLKMAFDTSNQQQTKEIIIKLNGENSDIKEALQKMTDERNMVQNKLLLQQQIQEESQEFFKDLIKDLEDKLLELRRIIQDKEYAIQEIEKNKTITDKDGQMVKIREIVTPNEQTLRLHEELESTRQILNKLSTESQNLTEENNVLKEMNFNFKRELIKLRVVLRSPVAFYKMKEFIYDDYYGNTDDNLELQNEIYSNPIINEHYQQGQSNMNPEILTQYGYPAQGQQQMKYLPNNERAIYQEKLQKSEALLKGFKELFEKEKNKNSLLTTTLNEINRQLQNALEINHTILKSQKQKNDKIEQLMSELSYYRKQYGNYMYLLKNKREATMNRSFEKNQNYQKFDNVKQLRIQSKTPNIRASSGFPLPAVQEVDVKESEENEQKEDVEVNVSILEEDKEQEQQQVQEQEYEQETEYQREQDGFKKKKSKGLVINTEYQDDEHLEQQQLGTSLNKKISQSIDYYQKLTIGFGIQNQNQYQMSLMECKQFLLTSAKELYLTYNLRMNNLQRRLLINNQPWNPPQPIWHQKSSSDPLDYFTLNFQDLSLNNPIPLQRDEAENPLTQLRNKNQKKMPNKNQPFQIDLSMIEKNKRKDNFKKPTKVTIEAEVSFLSNDNDNVLGDIEQ